MAIPELDIDFYADEAIQEPHAVYAKLRELGPVVWLPQHQVYALPCYKEVSHVLRHPHTFISSKGVSLNDKVNALLANSTLNSDPPIHDLTRSVTAEPLLPGSLHAIQQRVQNAADGLVDRLCTRGEFDAISDFAQYLPITLVTELVGLPESGKDNMLKWASATFNLFSDENPRALSVLPDLQEMKAFLDEYGCPEKLKPGGWAQRIFQVGPDRGLSYETCTQLMRDYINPSLDTTISATGQIIKLFADYPAQWDKLLDNPALIPNAVEEAVRLSTPIRCFSRYVVEDTELGGVTVPKDSRVLVIYASANLDPKKYTHPNAFDVTRDVHDHVGFGLGVHMCMGMHLARLEIISLLKALQQRVKRFHLTAEPVVAMNNTIRAYSSLPVRIERLDELQHQAARQAETVKQQADKQHAETVKPGGTQQQNRWLEVTVAKREMTASDVVMLELCATDGGELPAFSAGAHIDVQIHSGLIRHYSLCNSPNERARYCLGVLREPKSRGGSAAIHNGVQVGQVLKISQPRNHFPLDRCAKHTLLFAGGIGITPLLAMAYALDASGQSFELHYSSRTEERLAFRQELAVFGERIKFHLSSGPLAQRLVINTVLAEPDAGKHLYVCGPNGYIDFVIESAQNLAWAAGNVHVERFGAEIDANGEPFEVIAAQSGQTLMIQPGESIADKLLAAGIDVPMSCQSGVCGTCLVEVLEGTPDHRDLVQTELEKAGNQRITVCCSRSKSKTLVLDV